MMRDMEVYIGFYLILLYFLGSGQIIVIILYWQTRRVGCMLNPEVQEAFNRFDHKVTVNVINNPKCPDMVRRAYNYVKSLSKGMIQRPG